MLKRHDAGLAQVSQTLMFPNPAFTGEELILSIKEDAPGHLRMQVTRAQDGAECLTGEAVVTC
jgi:hypothetical protein